MIALVTGGSGFIGKHLLKALSYDKRFSSVVNYKIDITDESQVKAAMACRPDVVFHLAGKSTVKANIEKPFETFQVNALGTQKLLHYAPHGCKFVLASSATVYGDSGRNETDLVNPTSVYGASKIAAEALVQAYTAGGLVDGVILRLVANVGPGATHGVVKDIIEKLQSDSTSLYLFGAWPGSTKPYCYVGDTVNALIEASFQYNKDCSNIYNVSYGDYISIRCLAEIIMNAIDIYKPIVWLGSKSLWKGDNNFVWVYNDKIMEAGWWHPTYTNSEGMISSVVKEMVK
jgi:UDP-glucose 4-epimerase